MDMKPVSSSSIDEVGHDPETQTLAVKFKNGGTYHYEGVSAEEHKALMAAESVGKHFVMHIRSKTAKRA